MDVRHFKLNKKYKYIIIIIVVIIITTIKLNKSLEKFAFLLDLLCHVISSIVQIISPQALRATAVTTITANNNTNCYLKDPQIFYIYETNSSSK